VVLFETLTIWDASVSRRPAMGLIKAIRTLEQFKANRGTKDYDDYCDPLIEAFNDIEKRLVALERKSATSQAEHR
jgi:hypothetical protein